MDRRNCPHKRVASRSTGSLILDFHQPGFHESHGGLLRFIGGPCVLNFGPLAPPDASAAFIRFVVLIMRGDAPQPLHRPISQGILKNRSLRHRLMSEEAVFAHNRFQKRSICVIEPRHPSQASASFRKKRDARRPISPPNLASRVEKCQFVSSAYVEEAVLPTTNFKKEAFASSNPAIPPRHRLRFAKNEMAAVPSHHPISRARRKMPVCVIGLCPKKRSCPQTNFKKEAFASSNPAIPSQASASFRKKRDGRRPISPPNLASRVEKCQFVSSAYVEEASCPQTNFKKEAFASSNPPSRQASASFRKRRDALPTASPRKPRSKNGHLRHPSPPGPCLFTTPFLKKTQ